MSETYVTLNSLTPSYHIQTGHSARVVEFLKRFKADESISGVEVGVFQGDGAVALLDAFQSLHLTLVDQWEATDRYLKTCDPTALFVSDGLYRAVVDRMMAYGTRQQILRGSSLAASGICHDGAFDFVFIDAEHTRAGVLEDCRAWWSKVKAGGWLCGHDYGCGPQHPHVAGVTLAVQDFAQEVGCPIETNGEAGDFTWWMRKP